ncbi:MAG: hypothetical protein LBS30_02145, partial [Planctomycetota bacterium]|nr:hypothetical protein [Planctomycetota bacterium]
MKRLAASIVVCSAFLIGFGESRAFGEDAACPPGAKFCPTPGSGQASAPAAAPFGFGDAGPSFGADAQFARHASQLRDGEQLIMVAPSGDGMAMLPALPAQSPTHPPVAHYTSAAPVAGGMDFMPPPPGSPRPAASFSAPAGSGETLYATAPAPRQSPPAARRPAPAPAAPAPARRAAPAREPAKARGAAARVEPVSSPFTPSPESFARSRSAAS